jgi:acetyl esterase
MNMVPMRTGQPDAQMQSVLDRLAQEDAGMPDPTTLPPEEGRELALLSNRRWNRQLPEMRSVVEYRFARADGSGIDARLFVPPDVQLGLVMYIHGGGFAFCDIGTHERCVRLLATACSCPVLSIDYRLAPEHPFPAGLLDCIDVLRQLDPLRKDHPCTAGPLALAGDSSGANLALATMLHEHQHNGFLPDFAMLFYGVFGTDLDTPSYRQFENGPGLTRAKMMRYLNWYIPDTERNNPMVAPLLADDDALRALPPLYFNAAEIDPLCSDTERLVARLHGLGRQDQLQLYLGAVHGFMQMSLRLPAACRAIEDAGRAFRDLAGFHSSC